ncbi:MAG TPA: alpha/beta fold hydrolase [Myxococcota bacterium]|nr:alpha/beta fold hydrolase [Myxococcota bacterium]
MTYASFVSAEKSTTGRSNGNRPVRGLATLRRTLALATWLSPALAASWAARLFLTPRRFPRPERERALLATGEPLPREPGGVAAWQWGRGPTVLLVHGWEGRGAQLGAFVDPLVAAGYRVVTFDAPAHGDSPGRQATLVEFAAIIAALADRVGPLHGIVAHSFGAPGVALAFARGVEARAAVFIAPPVRMEEGAQRFAELLGLTPEVRQGMRRHVARRVGMSWEEIDGEALARRMTTPLLVVHDRDDDEVPLAAGATLAAAWPGARLRCTAGLGHRRVLRDAGVVQAAADFFAQFSPATRVTSDLERLVDVEAVRF